MNKSTNYKLSKIIITWRGTTCRITVTIEGVENAYLPGNVHFQYRPLGDIVVAVEALLEMLPTD